MKSFAIREEKCPVLFTAKTKRATKSKRISTTPPTDNKKQTSFLTLPHELRQQILLPAWSVSETTEGYSYIRCPRAHLLETLDEISSAVMHLSLTHREIKHDVEYVAGNWPEELEVYLEEGIKKHISLTDRQLSKETRRDFEVVRVMVGRWVVQAVFIGGYCYEDG